MRERRRVAVDERGGSRRTLALSSSIASFSSFSNPIIVDAATEERQAAQARERGMR